MTFRATTEREHEDATKKDETKMAQYNKKEAMKNDATKNMQRRKICRKFVVEISLTKRAKIYKVL